jgi:hypothetical protein
MEGREPERKVYDLGEITKPTEVRFRSGKLTMVFNITPELTIFSKYEPTTSPTKKDIIDAVSQFGTDSEVLITALARHQKTKIATEPTGVTASYEAAITSEGAVDQAWAEWRISAITTKVLGAKRSEGERAIKRAGMRVETGAGGELGGTGFIEDPVRTQVNIVTKKYREIYDSDENQTSDN